MDEEAINRYGITTSVPRRDEKYPINDHSRILAIDDLRFQLIEKLYKERSLDERDQQAIDSSQHFSRMQPDRHSSGIDLLRLFKIDRRDIDFTLDKGAVPVFDDTNRYHHAMLIIVALNDALKVSVLESLLSSVTKRVRKEIIYWLTTKVKEY